MGQFLECNHRCKYTYCRYSYPRDKWCNCCGKGSLRKTAKRYKAVVAEARFMRALSYFYLVRMYGDIPYVTNSSEAIEYQPRTAVADIYNKIIVPDLIEACASLPTVSRSGFSSTPSQWAAKALLSDVYMTMAGWPLKLGKEYYAKAAEVSLDIIEHSGLSLTPVYGDLWKEAKRKKLMNIYSPYTIL